jgi:hypothetical protein
MSRIEQLMAEVEAITVGEIDDEILTRGSTLLDDHKPLLACARSVGSHLSSFIHEQI